MITHLIAYTLGCTLTTFAIWLVGEGKRRAGR